MPPAARASELSQVHGAPSFAEYMTRCLYDPQRGYYSAGHVAFGEREHFWTYPGRLRPFFGQMVAEAARAILTPMLASGRVPAEARLTLLELGAGEGDLANDALTYIRAHEESEAWAPLAGRLDVVIGEVSEALRARQTAKLARHIRDGRASVRTMDARVLDWSGPFYGLVVANELLDNLPCEVLRVRGGGLDVDRMHVATDAPGRSGRQALEGGLDGNPTSLLPFAVPLALGWLDADDTAHAPPAALLDYLQAIAPLVADLHACDLLPVDLCWAPHLPRFTQGLAELLHGPQRCGAALLIDYGGSSRHVLDPRATAPHLRLYGPDAGRAHTATALHDPGAYDITWDVDFTELARLAREHHLVAPFYGHQGALECPPLSLWSRAAQRLLIAEQVRKGETDSIQATIKAHELVMHFRQAAGFWMMALAPDDYPWPSEVFGPPDAFRDEGLVTLDRDVDRDALQAALDAAGLPPTLSTTLKPCGDIVADLCDRHAYQHRAAVLALLDERGWLRRAGELAPR